MPAFSQARLKRRRATSKYSFSRTRTLGIGPVNPLFGGEKAGDSTGQGSGCPLRILGIESSCDESAVAVYDDAAGLLAHELFSQVDLHRLYGGVVPELASRDHVQRLLPLARQALAKSGT